MRSIRHFYIALLLAFTVQSASAFALLGPFAPWMNGVPGYQNGLAIGGPMNIGEGYRWNVPVVTYGYDKSFLDYFGSNGVAAVESAIQILNDLPPASAMDLTNYPFYSASFNDTAASENLMDLKSTTLILLLEQMGLTAPSTYVFCLSSNFNLGDAYHDVIVRNFDPSTLNPSEWVNDALLEYVGEAQATGWNVATTWLYPNGLVSFAVDPTITYQTAVEDNIIGHLVGYSWGYAYLPQGIFYQGLTGDDVGGLRYLLSATNIALESLIPGVRGSGANATNYVNRALRPGVEKITLQRLAYDSANNRFVSITNQYVDSYITNGSVQTQTLERAIMQPDILFTMHDLGFTHDLGHVYASRTGTTNWINNGLPSHDGPGVIQPPVVIALDQLGPSLFPGTPQYPLTAPSNVATWLWGSFDDSTNTPIVYPVNPPTTNFTTFRLWLSAYGPPHFNQSYAWNLSGAPNALFSLQTSTNLTDWLTIGTVTNLGGVFTYEDFVYRSTLRRYFRTMPQ